MPAQWRRGAYDRVDYVVVERDGVEEEDQIESEEPAATVDRLLRASHAKRQDLGDFDESPDSDSDDDDHHQRQIQPPMITPSPTLPNPASPTVVITMTLDQAQISALAESDPTETVVVAIPPPPHHEHEGGISQTTEHLLIAAGSIGATIIIVMIVLALYTMRKRGLSISDVVKQGKHHLRRGPPPPPLKYNPDSKLPFENENFYSQNGSVYAPQPAANVARSGSLSTQTPLQNLGRSDSFTQPPTREGADKSFYDDTSSHPGSHHRNDSATPSSAFLPIDGQRNSDSTHNTRSLQGDEEALRYSDPPQQQPTNAPPAPPTFRQFLSNRPNISQRPPFGGAGLGGIASRFSWTNSNAPQTPHDPSRDTVAQPLGRDSYMTSRSSVPRFRTIDSWVNQQSNRLEEQKLKQQFRMTQSTTYSEDEVPEMPKVPEVPEVPKNASGITSTPSGNGDVPGKDVKHQRHDTDITVQTAPIFKAHPGTEVRFSTRSAVPSEILDMGRQNAAL